jgi:hypothetical protein
MDAAKHILLFGKREFDHAGAFIAAAPITDATQQAALRTMVTSLKQAKLFYKHKALYPFVGGSATTHSFNLINTALYQMTWVNSPTHSANGVDFNGTSQYGRTGLIPSSVLTLNDTALHYYSRDNVAVTTIDLGSVNAAVTNLFRLIIRTATDTILSDQYNGTDGRLSAANTDSRGLFTTSRISAASHEVYRNGASLGSNATAGGALPDVEFYIGAQNIGGAPSAFGQRQCAFCAIGEGLTPSEASTFYTIIQAYQTTLSRQV